MLSSKRSVAFKATEVSKMPSRFQSKYAVRLSPSSKRWFSKPDKVSVLPGEMWAAALV